MLYNEDVSGVEVSDLETERHLECEDGEESSAISLSEDSSLSVDKNVIKVIRPTLAVKPVSSEPSHPVTSPTPSSNKPTFGSLPGISRTKSSPVPRPIQPPPRPVVPRPILPPVRPVVPRPIQPPPKVWPSLNSLQFSRPPPPLSIR